MIKLPNSWEDIFLIDGYYCSDDSEIVSTAGKTTNDDIRNLFKTREQAAASIALAQLSQLRDVYRQGWEPDWNRGGYKYCIIFSQYRFTVELSFYNSNFLSFQDVETADLYLENFIDLIEQAKPLMS